MTKSPRALFAVRARRWPVLLLLCSAHAVGHGTALRTRRTTLASGVRGCHETRFVLLVSRVVLCYFFVASCVLISLLSLVYFVSMTALCHAPRAMRWYKEHMVAHDW